MIWESLIIIHIIVCVTVSFLLRNGKLKSKSMLLPVVFFIPLWGLLLLFIEEVALNKISRQGKKIDIDKLKVDEKRFGRIRVDQNTSQSITVPLEEAMLINDAKTRRALMLEILHKSPEEYIDMLQKAKSGNDVELTHYATTTIMEIQSDYENSIHLLTEQLSRNPQDRTVLELYYKKLLQYVNSGLLNGNILQIQRNRLSETILAILDGKWDQQELVFNYVENELELGHFGHLEEVITKVQKSWPKEEKTYQFLVELYRKTGRGDKISEILDLLIEQDVYLSADGKKWFNFWAGGERIEKKSV